MHSSDRKGTRASDLEDETVNRELSLLPLITHMKVRDPTVHNYNPSSPPSGGEMHVYSLRDE